MNIVIGTDTYYPSVNGAAYFTYRLATMLGERGHTVSVLCPSQSLSNTITTHKNVTVYGIRSLHIPIYQNFRATIPYLTQYTIDRIVKNISPDILHIQNHFIIGKGMIRTAKKYSIPIIGTNHFMPENLLHYLPLPTQARERAKKWGWKNCIQAFHQLDLVTTPTQKAASLLHESGFMHTITPLSCGIDLERFNPTNNGSYLLSRYRIPQNTPVLLYVGRLDKEKRIDVIIRALPTILRSIPVHLVLAGIGEEREKLEDLAKELNLTSHITFTGFIPDEDMPNIYRIADVFTIASVAELQSIVTMEAMASGLPVVAANMMALPELVIHGKNGYLFTNGASEELANSAISILTDTKRKESMARKSLELIQNHDSKKIIEKYENIYRATINRKA